jgi:hypothetical protein
MSGVVGVESVPRHMRDKWMTAEWGSFAWEEGNGKRGVEIGNE